MSARIGALALVLVAFVTLTGCQSTEDYAAERLERLVKLAKICEDAGGTYDYNASNGYHCLFDGEDTKR